MGNPRSNSLSHWVKSRGLRKKNYQRVVRPGTTGSQLVLGTHLYGGLVLLNGWLLPTRVGRFCFQGDAPNQPHGRTQCARQLGMFYGVVRDV